MLLRYILSAGLLLILACSSIESDGPWLVTEPPFSAAVAPQYERLLGCFPSDRQGFGIDPGVSVPDHQPMTYALVVSAEARRFKATADPAAEHRIVEAVQWLVSNSDLDGDSLPGWGLPQAWDAFSDGTVNPPHSVYTITTAFVLYGLLDALDAGAIRSQLLKDSTECLVVDAALRLARSAWSDTNDGGYFWYSPNRVDAHFLPNVSAMMVGAVSRMLRTRLGAIRDEQRLLLEQRMHQAANTIVHAARMHAGLPYWNYIPPPNFINQNAPSDLLHHVYVLWGLEEYREYPGATLPWDRLASAQSIMTFVRNGSFDNFTLHWPGPPSPPKLWAVGTALAFVSRWGDPYTAYELFDAIQLGYGIPPEVTMWPRSFSSDSRFYPRQAAHLLLGIAELAFGKLHTSSRHHRPPLISLNSPS
ncbi:MAG: hypothetical protein ACYC7A_05935 [Thermoanaerobaculia bacterium]